MAFVDLPYNSASSIARSKIIRYNIDACFLFVPVPPQEER